MTGFLSSCKSSDGMTIVIIIIVGSISRCICSVH